MKNGKKSRNTLLVLIATISLFGACSKNSDDDRVIVITANGDINPKLDQFRNILGIQLNVVPGVSGGRREINWDGVAPEFINVALPGDFFNTIADGTPAARQRGFVYGSPTGEFRVSTSNFAEVNAAAADQFGSFSGDKSFANISSALWDAEFRVAGQDIAATVQGFGVVFSDVDIATSTSLEFFNGTRSLGKFFAPAKAAGSNFSFLGVYFKDEKITRVRVGHDGKLTEGIDDISNGGTRDLVVLDDLLYDEPVKK
ncbi:MAG: hypothetical protein H7Y31_12490 [Chitinophagaceae bacterium]|nr:hypothetical protein [Chitinophagaceae bacterium]